MIFSQSAIFRLHQLGSQLYQHTGIRHKLSTPQGIVDLLRVGALSQEKDIRACYDSFVLELNKRQIDSLAARGVSLRQPRTSPSSHLRQTG
jgi:hypothetical protein